MLRISVTTIEQFRKYIDEDVGKVWNRSTEELEDYIKVTEEKLLENITNPNYSTTSTTLGTAFHDILENPHEAWYRFENQLGKPGDFMSKTGQIFPYDMIVKCYDTIDYRFPFEIKDTQIINLGNETIEIVAKCDQYEGLLVNEHKSKWGTISWGKDENGEQFQKIYDPFYYEEYYKSCQWKYYLQVFKAIAVQYKVFSIATDKTDNHSLKLLDIHPFELYPYDGMQDYLQNLLEQFVEYIHFRNLEEYFKPKK